VLRSGAIESPLGASTFKTACFAALGGVIVALLHGSSPRTGNKGHRYCTNLLRKTAPRVAKVSAASPSL
jgi:hypothetical protein